MERDWMTRCHERPLVPCDWLPESGVVRPSGGFRLGLDSALCIDTREF